MGFQPQQLRTLGTCGLKVSPLGIGTVKLGRNTGIKYPQAFDLPDDHQVSVLLETARTLGINLIDTAPAYGISEQRLGQLLPGSRSDWVVCTKVGEQYQDQKSHYDFSAKATRLSLETSLRHLRTDYLDIVLVHCADDDLDILQHSGVLAELDRFKSRGYIKAIGASTKSVAAGLLAVEETDIVMLTCNLDDQSQQPVLERARALNKGVLLKKLFASGHLQDNEAAINFAMTQRAVASAIIGTINPTHLAANVSAAVKALQP